MFAESAIYSSHVLHSIPYRDVLKKLRACLACLIVMLLETRFIDDYYHPPDSRANA
jgi:hypothetical protein